jgi:hypothetical protein
VRARREVYNLNCKESLNSLGQRKIREGFQKEMTFELSFER